MFGFICRRTTSPLEGLASQATQVYIYFTSLVGLDIDSGANFVISLQGMSVLQNFAIATSIALPTFVTR